MMGRPHFRFEDLEIWQKGKDIAVQLHQLSEKLQDGKYYRYAEQAGMISHRGTENTEEV